MPGETAIEWTDATWNPVSGCSKVSQGCKNCYAERVTEGWPLLKGKGSFEKIELHPELLNWPLRWRGSKQAKAEGRPSRIFVNSMSDLFHESVPPEFIDKVFAVMALAPHHVFQILTKRPERMLNWATEAFTEKGGIRIGEAGSSLFHGMSLRDRNLSAAEEAEISNQFEWNKLRHVWLGVSVEDQKTADERIPLLLQTPAAVRFVSYEPALAAVDFRHIQSNREVEIDALTGDHGVYRPLAGRSGAKLTWVIAGGESGPHARPAHPDWFRSARDQCQAAGVAYFFKQWGEWFPRDQWEYNPELILPDDQSAYIESPHTHVFDSFADGYCATHRVGKKRAGRLLDGRIYDEFPVGREWQEFPRENG